MERTFRSDTGESCVAQLPIYIILKGNEEKRSYINQVRNTRDVPKVMRNFFVHANWEQQMKKSAVVDGTSYCVILECLVTSIACIT